MDGGEGRTEAQTEGSEDGRGVSPEARGGAGLSLLAVAMLAYAVFGDPPHSYFLVMRWSIAAVCGFWAVAAWQRSKALAPLALAIAALGALHAVGDMRREEWLPWNVATACALLTFGVVAVIRETAGPRKWAVVAVGGVILCGFLGGFLAQANGSEVIWIWDPRFWK